MIGKPNWFQRRKYSGWGITPKDWRGWAYIAVVILIVALIQYLPIGSDNEQIKTIITLILVGIFALDTIHIMVNLPIDERERIHEAIAERNALWSILAVLTAGIAWQASTGIVKNEIQIDPIIIAAVIIGLIAKAATNIYLNKKN